MYRYVSLEGKYGLENFKRLFEKREIRLASAIDFNEPYECFPVFENDLTTKQVFERYKWIKSKPLSEMQNNIDRETWLGLEKISINKIRKHITIDYIKNKLFPEISSLAKSSFETFGVCCFSKIPNSSPMWAYYASSHTGICIEFSPSPGLEKSFAVQEVIYCDSRPIINSNFISSED